ncbi:uncharacterized protein LOC123316924 [Coccinella septempunctata]|uniref:uncharacterized protein LOC123316924 n=1 Tax=Coccinella septempunctata TaxID=41139 RepID=UPI001D08694C|nr:uncharacterized protein LOC123316924 [Coccinella septempunctata]XP_044759172.1 uncharacterized protein LOC123316924 [Coccinella septempunctata]XP_044759173.1 uncharacterized protein LOC123316924 [Coccinella septempunctata]XP_044759174.1 uncharacterized protein LOC123316924 [Coccinella septempunctata]XP_044759175.1 uncharacterized protein LOC123316924 [Coccinella septempunctata]
MQAVKQISLLIFLFVWTIARCFPPIPLNERSTEKLTYEAYLLIEESLNQQKDSTLERRIKEKSIFIAPIISPENSPECGNDRCKKLMPKKEIPLENLLQLINQQYGFMEENEEDITTGPLYINIPLKAVQEETDLTMLIAPTKNAALEMEIDNNRTPSEEKVNMADIAGILGIKKVGESETVTSSTTDAITRETTTETTTVNTQGYTTETNALFYDAKRQVELKTDSTTMTSTTANTGSTEDFAGESTTEKPNAQDSELTLYQMDQALPYPDSSVSFVDVKREAETFKDKPMMSEKTSERPPTVFTVRSTLIVPKKDPLPPIPLPRVSTPTPFTLPTASAIFTPIDNVLNMEDNTKTIFSEGFQRPTHDSLFGVNKKFFPKVKDTDGFFTTRPSETTSEAVEYTKKITNRVVFPTVSTTPTSTRTFMVRFPSASHHVRFPASSSSAIPTTPSGISDNYGEQSRTSNPPIDRGDTLKNIPEVNLTYAIPIHVNLTSLYERIKAQRENHRNRDKHSEWFHLPTKWWDTSQRPPVLRISKKNGHMDVQEVSPDNFFRQFNARSFGLKPAIQR